MAIGKNVKHLRKLAGDVSRGVVARAIDPKEWERTSQAIYALESRDSTRSDLAPAIADFFRVSLDALVRHDLTGLSLEEIRALGPPPRSHLVDVPRAAQEVENYAVPPTKISGAIDADYLVELVQLLKQVDDEWRANVLSMLRSAVSINGASSGIIDDDSKRGS